MVEHEFRFVITPFCNYRCFFCHGEGTAREHTPVILTPEDYAFLATIGRERWGWNTATVTGGEPLLSPIYKDTCKLLKESGVRVTTVTNASLLVNPRELLKDNAQVNISLHSLDPEVYKNITQTSYPIETIIDTIVKTRMQLPELEIHLNATIIRGLNDDVSEWEDIIRFATKVGAVAKFIDLASDNTSLIVPVDEMIMKLDKVGFRKSYEDVWRATMRRGEDEIMLIRCGFGKAYQGWTPRSLFVDPSGRLSMDGENRLSVNILRETQDRDEQAVIEKVEWFFPPAKRALP